MRTLPLRPVLDYVVLLHQFPGWFYKGSAFTASEWLEALILVESSGNPLATRYEPHQDRKPDGDTTGVNDGQLEDDRSYGLMQLMGYNARVLIGAKPNTPLDFSFLFDPMANLSLGCRLLSGELRAVGRNVERALARYNGGPTGDDLDPRTGDMRLRVYVDKVYAMAQLVHGDRQQRAKDLNDAE